MCQRLRGLSTTSKGLGLLGLSQVCHNNIGKQVMLADSLCTTAVFTLQVCLLMMCLSKQRLSMCILRLAWISFLQLLVGENRNALFSFEYTPISIRSCLIKNCVDHLQQFSPNQLLLLRAEHPTIGSALSLPYSCQPPFMTVSNPLLAALVPILLLCFLNSGINPSAPEQVSWFLCKTMHQHHTHELLSISNDGCQTLPLP